LESPPDDLKQILGPSEQVQLYLKQKIYRPTINIDSVVITNMRVILRHPHALGLKKDYTDYNYQDISNVELAKGLTRSTLRFTLRLGGDPLALDSIPNDQAQKAYGLVRENLLKFQSPYAAAAAGVMPAGVAPPQQVSSAGYCNKCGTPLSAGQMFCGRCGSPVSSAAPTVIEKEVVKVRCQYCGFLNDSTDSACKSCGAKI
jgi:DNA-directed RNA polymerase subunit RPC12/RpoP